MSTKPLTDTERVISNLREHVRKAGTPLDKVDCFYLSPSGTRVEVKMLDGSRRVLSL